MRDVTCSVSVPPGQPRRFARKVLVARQDDGQIVIWNDAAERLLGWGSPDALGNTFANLDLAPLDELGDEAMAAGAGARLERELLLRCADGPAVEVLAHVTSSPPHMPGGAVYVLSDLSSRVVGEQPDPVGHDPLELVQYSADVVALMDSDGVMSFVSSPVLREFGWSDDDLVGLCVFDFVHPEEQDRVRHSFATIVDEGMPSCPLTLRFRTRSGRYLWLEGRAINLLRRSTLHAVLVTLHDVTHRVEVESALAHRATHDALTDLPNRALFLDRLHHVLEHARRSDELVAVFYWDIDQFKLVNDSGGHAVGDSLLVEVAHRATAAMRAEDTVARIGGDEFVACAAVSNVEQVTALAERLRDALVVQVTLAGRGCFQVTASLGVAFGMAVDAERLLSESDVAMYESKRSGGRAISIVSADPVAEPQH